METSGPPLTSGQSPGGQAKSTNNGKTTEISDAMKRTSLSGGVTTSLPPSPSAAPHSAKKEPLRQVSPQLSKCTSRNSPKGAAPTADNDRSKTPSLHKRASLNSLHEARTPSRSPAVRRTSSYFPPSPTTTRSSLSPSIEDPPKQSLTAASIAREFFEKDLAQHEGASGQASNARTSVILQDDCYGHRYSRPRTSKSSLSTIVERPERIQASVTGIASAYVRLGGRHRDGAGAPHPQRDPASLPLIPFRIIKTLRSLSVESPAAVAVHGAGWMDELKNMCDAAESKLAIGGKELSRSAGSDQKLHEGDLYLCSGSLSALEGALGGVCEAVDTVFDLGRCKRAFVGIRPPGHHCSADMPSGFCWLNNVHVGIAYASMFHGLTHAAIIDFDLHHGDGSQAITWRHNSRIASLSKNTPMSKKTSIGYFSLHDINSYPCEMGDDEKVRNASLCIENAHGQSIWNVHLQPWRSEADFWALYESKYLVVLQKARTFLRSHSDRLRQVPTHPEPKAAIFISAGFDASEWETPYMQRHKVNVPTSFYTRFTHDIVRMSEESDLGVDGRVISVLEGGYSDRALTSGVFSHLCGLASQEGLNAPCSQNASNAESAHTNGLSETLTRENKRSPVDMSKVDPSWWSLQNLEELEEPMAPKVAAAPPKKQRGDVKPTYITATESYKAKIINPPAGRRSLSGSLLNNQLTSGPPRQPTPPPPEVDWATASVELSRLLVPSDRQTSSCKPEELNAEASRARRARQSSIGLPVETACVDPQRMQLREKRPNQQKFSAEDVAKPVLRASRRTTIANVNLLPSETEASSPVSESAVSNQDKKPTRRRSSVASSVISVATDYSLASVAESQKPQDQLRTKRSRAAAKPHMEPPKPKATRRPAATQRMSSQSSVSSRVAPSGNNMVDDINADPIQLNSKDNDALPDVNQLASGMKKMSIKFKVPPRNEHDAQAKSSAAPKGRPPKANTKRAPNASSPQRVKAKATLPTKAKAKGLNPASSFPTGTLVYSDNKKDSHVDTTSPSLERQTLSSNLGMTEKMVSEATAAASPLHPAVYNAANPSAPVSTTSALPPSKASTSFSSAPSPSGGSEAKPGTPVTVKRTKQDLPIFTPTSPIDFGKKALAPASSGIDHVMSDAPEQADPISSDPLVPGSKFHPSNVLGNSNGDSQIHQPPKLEDQNQASVWDIPDTPQPKRS